MCGIVGILNYGEGDADFEAKRREVGIYLLTTLLKLTKPRGKDATGVVTLFRDGRFIGQKMPVPSDEFIVRWGEDKTDFNSYIKMVRNSPAFPRVTIGHCRASSVGGKYNNDNNHPIKVNSIIGVHNGTLKNHTKIFKNLGVEQIGTVDSEAIMHLYDKLTSGGVLPFTTEMVKKVADHLEGSYATLVLNTSNIHQVVCTREGRPVELAYLKDYKMLVVASERGFLDEAFYNFNLFIELFNPGTGLSKLTKSSVLYDKIVDGTGLVFNLTVDDNDVGKVSDLYSQIRLPYSACKWQSVTTKQTSNYASTRSTGNTHTATKTSPSSQGSTTTKGKSRGRFKWDDDKSTFIKDGELDNAEKSGTNILYLEDNSERSSAKTKSTVIVDLYETDSQPPANHYEDAFFEVTTIEAAKSKTTADSSDDTDKAVGEKKQQKKRIIRMDIPSEALSLATEAIKKLPKMTNNTEAALTLGLSNGYVLQNMAPIGIANRAYKFGYMQGFCDAIDESGVRNSKPIMEVYIKMLKGLVSALCKCISEQGISYSTLRNIITQARKSNSTINLSNYTRVFSKGDLMISASLQRVFTVLEEGERNEAK